MNNKNFLLIISLALLLYFIVKFVNIMAYSPEPTLYSGGSIYFLKLVSNTGHLVNESTLTSLGITPFAAGMLENAKYPIVPTLYVMMSIVSNIPISSWGYNITISLLYAIPISLVSLSIYCYISKRMGQTIDYKIGFLVLLYSLMVSPHFIKQLGATGWTFTLFIVFLVFYKLNSNWEISIMSLIFLCSLPFFYFTGASFFLMWFSVATLYFLYENKFTNTPFSNVFLFFVVIYFAYVVYISFTRFTPAIHVFTTLLLMIKEGFTSFVTSAPVVSLDYIPQTSIYNKLRVLFNCLLLATPLLLVLISKNKFPDKLSNIRVMIYSGIMALPLLTILSYVWLSSFGLARVVEYSSLISVLTVSTLLPLLKGKMKKILIIIVILALISSVYAYEVDESNSYTHITYKEDFGARWFSDYVSNNSSIFTDQRLSATLISKGFLKVGGVIETQLGSNTTTVLDSLYYNKNGNVSETLKDYHFNIQYFYFSNQMTKKQPGIYLYNYPVISAPPEFLSKYDNDTNFNKIYDNGESFVYKH